MTLILYIYLISWIFSASSFLILRMELQNPLPFLVEYCLKNSWMRTNLDASKLLLNLTFAFKEEAS